MPTVPFSDTLNRELKDPMVATAFLNDALEHGSPEEVADAVQLVLGVNGASSAAKPGAPSLSEAIELLRRCGIVVGSFRLAA